MMRILFLSLIALVFLGTKAGHAQSTPRPVLLAHYMPWFEARPYSPHWGWHWTMNAVKPDVVVDGQPSIAAHLNPLIGPYDSGDPTVLEYHLLTMKLAGIDGVIVDWYGLQEFRDYALLHRNTQKLVEWIDRLGMKFAICYEDQTIPALVTAGRLKAEQRVEHARHEIQWLAENWFTRKSYLHLDQKPVLLSFGQTGLTDAEWAECLNSSQDSLAYFSLHHRRTAAAGAFDWPIPQQGLAAVERFRKDSLNWPQAIPVVFPRFVDYYAQANVGPSYGRIEDRDGATFRELLEAALLSKAPIIQIATWNDWGEGTVVEPSREYGYRDLLMVSSTRRGGRISGESRRVLEADLRLPLRLLELRKASKTPDESRRCDEISRLLAVGKVVDARDRLPK